ncbi:MAG: ATP-binding protein [Bilifractor sp.]
MIKKLRRKLIMVSMLAVTIVLFIIIGAINILNYNSIATASDRILNIIRDNGGSLSGLQMTQPMQDPGQNGGDVQPQNQEDVQSQSSESPQPQNGAAAPSDNGQMPGPGMENSIITEETPYESRYFSVIVDDNGDLISADMNHIVSVDSAQAAEFAKEILQTGKTKGFIQYYRFLVYQVSGEATTHVCFLDCQRSLASFHSFLSLSMLVSLIGIAAVYVLVILLSRKVMQPVEESYRKQKRFVTDAGHELKTPLTIIDADASVLEMDIGDNEWLTDIRKQTKRMTDLTGDLIFLARMDEGSTRMNMLDFPLSDVLSETAQSFRSLAQVQGKDFQAEIEPMITMHGDEKSIRELISILLDNALKYSDENGQIRAELRKKNKAILLTVENTAEQIDKETLAHMFDRFYRADSSRNSEKGGYGIGLSVAEAVVTAHKGKITAASPDGKSIRITAVFPLQS